MDFKEELKQVIDSFYSCMQSFGTESKKEMRQWMTDATLQIWAANKLCSEDYKEVLEYLSGNTYTTAQITTALQYAGEPNHKVKIPRFFEKLVLLESATDHEMCRMMISAIGSLLTQLAMSNGDFTIEEAYAVQEIVDMLQSYCDDHNIKPEKIRVWDLDSITALKTTGYYQQSSEPDKKTTVPNQQGSPAQSAQTVNIDESTEDTLESVLEELNSLIGLDKVKKDVQSLLNFLRVCKLRTERGMKVPTVSYHLVFTGNPGTGKTTVARLVAKLYHLMGILPQGQFIETDRSGLVAGYLGQTAIKTQGVIQEALGGVLFIDEAYALVNDDQDSFGKEAIETILKAMEDHRNELVVIVAGYDDLMREFIDSNPGLRSRFNKYFQFPDYDGDDLMKIMERFCKVNGYSIEEDAIPELQNKLHSAYENRNVYFGNARYVRNLFENAIHNQADRLSTDFDITDDELTLLTKEDILAVLEGR